MQQPSRESSRGLAAKLLDPASWRRAALAWLGVRQPARPSPPATPTVAASTAASPSIDAALVRVGAAVPWPTPDGALERRVVLLCGTDPLASPRIESQARALSAHGVATVVVGPQGVSRATDWGASVTFDLLPHDAFTDASGAPSLFSESLVAAVVRHRPFAVQLCDPATALSGLDGARALGAACVLDGDAWALPPHDQGAVASADESLLRELAVLALRRAHRVVATTSPSADALRTLASLAAEAALVIGDGDLAPLADAYDRLWRETGGRTAAASLHHRAALQSRPLRVLHAPCNVGNQPWTLSRAERRRGLGSELVITYTTWLNYPADRILGPYADRAPGYVAARKAVVAGAAADYDVLHYYFGRGLSTWDDLSDLAADPLADMKAARARGKTIVMTLQGCDARIAGESNARNAHTACAPGRCTAYETCIATLDAQRREMIAQALPLCDRVFYLNPELGHSVPQGRFMPYANVDIAAFQPVAASAEGRPRIVHAPSNASLKGTPAILAALERLAARHDFELILVQGRTHEEAMAIYRTADIAIDQALVGWYGGFAVEMMAMGKPVMCYLREDDFRFVPPAMLTDLPILNIHPDRLEADIEAVLQRRAEWPAWSRASRAFVEKWHDPDTIAAWLAGLYADPADVRMLTPATSPEAAA